jgi:hypothetical protein
MASPSRPARPFTRNTLGAFEQLIGLIEPSLLAEDGTVPSREVDRFAEEQLYPMLAGARDRDAFRRKLGIFRVQARRSLQAAGAPTDVLDRAVQHALDRVLADRAFHAVKRSSKTQVSARYDSLIRILVNRPHGTPWTYREAYEWVDQHLKPKLVTATSAADLRDRLIQVRRGIDDAASPGLPRVVNAQLDSLMASLADRVVETLLFGPEPGLTSI